MHTFKEVWRGSCLFAEVCLDFSQKKLPSIVFIEFRKRFFCLWLLRGFPMRWDEARKSFHETSGRGKTFFLYESYKSYCSRQGWNFRSRELGFYWTPMNTIVNSSESIRQGGNGGFPGLPILWNLMGIPEIPWKSRESHENPGSTIKIPKIPGIRNPPFLPWKFYWLIQFYLFWCVWPFPSLTKSFFL